MNFLSQLTPELRSALLKLQNVNPNNDVNEENEAELDEIAAKIVASDLSSVKKLNVGKVLTNMEKGLYAANLSTSDVSSIKLDSKGLPDGALAALPVAMLNQLIDLGVVEYDGTKITKFDAELASRILDTNVEDWSDFCKKFCENSFSYVEDMQSFSDANISRYFVGPLLQYSSQEDANNNQYSDLRYTLNFDAILEDFAHYPGWIETPEDLMSAIQWKSQNDIGVNGKIDEDTQQRYIGDCWLLSGMLALASSEDGAKAIENAIQVQTQPDGTKVVVVEFKGAIGTDGKPVKITVTADEIRKYDSDLTGVDLLSSGDNDMLVMELATNKLEEMLRKGEAVTSPEIAALFTTPSQFDFKAYSPDYINSFLEGSDASRMIYMLTGAVPDWYYDNLTRENIYQILQNAAENPGTVLSFGLYAGSEHKVPTIDGGTFEFNLTEGGHAFAVTDVQKVLDNKGNVDYDKSTVTFVNPWDSSKKITVSWKEFVNLDACSMSSTCLNEQIEGTTKRLEAPSPWEDSHEYNDNDRIELIIEDFEDGNLTVKQLMALLIQIDSIKNAVVSYENNNTLVTITKSDGEEITISCNTDAVNDGVKGRNGRLLRSSNEDNDTINANTFEFDNLEDAIKELDLHSTFLKDVYSSSQKRYLWNEAAHVMTEI